MTEKALYQVVQQDEMVDNCPFILADCVEDAFDMAKKEEAYHEYINENSRELGELTIIMIDLKGKVITYYYWNDLEEIWDIDHTSVIM